MNNIRQLTLGTINLADTYGGKLPPAAGAWDAGKPDKVGTVHYYILPFIEQGNIYNLTTPNTGNSSSLSSVIKTYYAPLDNSNDGVSSKISYAANQSLFVLNVGARYPSVFNQKGTTNEILYAERYAQTGYTTHVWAAVTGNSAPWINIATCAAPIFGQSNTAINTAGNDQTAHAFSTAGFLVCVGDASTRLMNTSADNSYTYVSIGTTVTLTTFNWASDWLTTSPPPSNGSW